MEVLVLVLKVVQEVHLVHSCPMRFEQGLDVFKMFKWSTLVLRALHRETGRPANNATMIDTGRIMRQAMFRLRLRKKRTTV